MVGARSGPSIDKQDEGDPFLGKQYQGFPEGGCGVIRRAANPGIDLL